MVSYIAIMLGFSVQTSTLLQQGRSEYLSGHFAAAERLLVDGLAQLPQDDVSARAKALGNLGDIYSEQEEYVKAEGAYFSSFVTLEAIIGCEQLSPDAAQPWNDLFDPGEK